jgi:hypothetical protein
VQGIRPEDRLQGRQVDDRSRKGQLEEESRLFEKIPISLNEARLVRAAKAVPTWQAVIPAKVIVVAARLAPCNGLPGSVDSPGDQPAE